MRSRLHLIVAALVVAVTAVAGFGLAPAGAAPEDPSVYVLQWGSFGNPPDTSVFNRPSGVAVAPNGDVYVADTQNDRVQRFSSVGVFELEFGGTGTGNSQFNDPRDVGVDASGNVYVVDTGNDRVQKFNADGLFITVFGGFGNTLGTFDNPSGIAFAPDGDVYVADTENDRIQRFTNTGASPSSFGIQGDGELEFNDPWDVAVDSDGKVYVADTGNNRIQIVDDSGAFVDEFGAVGTAPGLFNTPRGIDVDATERVWVADSVNHRLQVFENDGTFQSQMGGNGTGNGQFDQPNGVSVAPDGRAFVADTRNDRVQKVGPQVDFDDVTTGNVFYDEITWIAAGGYANGYSFPQPPADPVEGSFYWPSAPLTRQAMSAFLYRLAGSPAGPFPDPGFADVSVTHPFYTTISWLATTGITTGYGDNTFRPGADITRQAMAAFMFRYRGSPSGSFPNPGFSDVSTSLAFYEEVAWAADVGVVNGYVDGTFRPSAPVTRQAMASFLFGLSELGVPVI